MKIERISDIYGALEGESRKPRLAVAYANDAHSVGAADRAVATGLVEAILVGDTEIIRQVCRENGYDESRFRIVHEADERRAAEKAVETVRAGEADIIMKGLVSTDKFMRAVLDKECGLLPPKAVLSHVAVLECEAYHKLLVVSDVAIIPCPDLEQKKAMIRYVTAVSRVLGNARPKVALIAPTEQVLPKIQSTVDAAILAKMGERGQIAEAAIEGPMGLDVALDRESAETKKIRSEVAGDADCLIFPNLETGNVFYKTNTKLGRCHVAGLLWGARVPAVLSSRGDSIDDKVNSIALAAYLSLRDKTSRAS